MSNNVEVLSQVQEAEKLLLTEQLVKTISTGCNIPHDKRERALSLGINIIELTELVDSLYEEPSDDEEGDADVWY